MGHMRPGAEEPATRAGKVEDLTVTKKDLENFYYTLDGCPRCDYMITWGHSRGCTSARSEECRRRIAEELSKIPEGRKRLQRVEARKRKAAEQESAEVLRPAPPNTRALQPRGAEAANNASSSGTSPPELPPGEASVKARGPADELLGSDSEEEDEKCPNLCRLAVCRQADAMV